MNNKIILLSCFLVTRFVIAGTFIDLNEMQYGEYGYIANNLHNGNGYSLFAFDGERAMHIYDPEIKPFPSAYMLPGYVYFLYPFFSIDDVFTRNVLIVIIQVLIGIGVLLLLFNLTKIYFSEKAAYIACWFYILIPEFGYSTIAFNSIVIYHLFVLLAFITLFKLENSNFKLKYVIILGILFSSIIYFRAEFILFVVLILSLFVLKKRILTTFIISGLIVLSLTPWIVRNYLIFDKFVPLTTTTGLNLYRGNNNLYIGNWGDDYIIDKILENSKDPNYEIIMNDIYVGYTINIIKEEPVKFAGGLGTKLFYFLSINPNEPNTSNPLYYLPWFILLFLSIAGIIKTFDFRKYKYFYLFFIFSIVVSIVFLPLPRYQIMMKILFIPFAAFGFQYYYFKIKEYKNINGKFSN